ncbi:MAG: hypothetical protein K8T89_21710 [Planctomycetes bacterium]|nr:hypothetical protein [Planctomycetota bacterium]
MLRVEQMMQAESSPLYDPDDELTDEDLAAIAADCLRRFAEEHPDDDWGYDVIFAEKNV